MKREIVVARYMEDLGWLYRENPSWKAVVYDKSGSTLDNFWLKNIGRESHTYLFYICSQYNRLADITVFLQGAPLEHFSRENLDRLLTCEPKVMAGLNLVNIVEWDNSGQLSEAWRYGQWADKMRRGEVRRCPLSYTAWHEKYIGPLGKPAYYMGAMFAVTREVVHRRPRAFYETLLNQLDHVDPEEAYYLERCWPAVFKAESEAEGLNLDALVPGNPKGFGRVTI